MSNPVSRALARRTRVILHRLLRDQFEQIHSLELFREQTLARHAEAVGLLRRDLSDLALQLSEFRVTYAMSVADLVPKMAALRLAVNARLGAPDGNTEASERTPPQSPASVSQPPVAELDSFYIALSEAFGGSPAAIRDRARDYVADLASVRDLGPVLDVGCGRGELLDVLREAGFDAYGVDTNALCVEECRRLGLTVELADARQHLNEVAPSSLAAITALHLVEHLSIESVIGLIDAAMVALRPGGVLIIETPNPENVLAGSLYFFLDPSHRQPIPPQLLQFILTSRGIVDLEIRRPLRQELTSDVAVPSPTEGEPWFGDLRPLVDAFNGRFASAADYALIARRP